MLPPPTHPPTHPPVQRPSCLALLWLLSSFARLAWTFGMWLFELFVPIGVRTGLWARVLEAAAFFLLVLLLLLSSWAGCREQGFEV